ncbi:MAG: XdhC family protein [Candidatus Cloacimonetes bacterium]|nr:XdhC family protein [Candidatus Cloacimonadota bacterium]
MKDAHTYYERLKELMSQGLALWQVTIIGVTGSTPAKPGMKMLIPAQDKEFGNLGGGELEYVVINYVRSNQPVEAQMLHFRLDNSGSKVDIDLNPIKVALSQSAPSNSEIDTNMICGGKVSVFIEPLFRKNHLYIIGAGHCGRALAHLAKLCDFYVVMIDNRKELLEHQALRSADRICHSNYTDLVKHIEFNDNAYIVIMTHGHIHDKQVLQYCLRRRSKYIGMIGSRSKVPQILTELGTQGYSDEDLARVHAPIGLPINSHTPYEIAVSILAELISIRNTACH